METEGRVHETSVAMMINTLEGQPALQFADPALAQSVVISPHFVALKSMSQAERRDCKFLLK